MRMFFVAPIFATAGLALFAGAQPAIAQDMTGAERTALHGEIRSYLLDNPDIIVEMLAILEDQRAVETAAADRRLVSDNAESIFSDGYSFVGGNPEGSLTVVEFLDYQCSYCRRAHPEVAELIESDGDIRWIVKEFPILGPASMTASRAAIATLIEAGPDAYEALNDRLMRLQGPVDDTTLDDMITQVGLEPEEIRAAMDDPEIARRIRETRALAGTLSVSGTPTFVFGDRVVRGYMPLPAMRDLVDEIRAAEG